MGNERLILAIGQMERALSRLEKAQAKLRETKPKPENASRDDGLLESRLNALMEDHQALKRAASDALSQIDGIIANEERQTHA